MPENLSLTQESERAAAPQDTDKPVQAEGYASLYVKAVYEGWKNKLNFGEVLDIVEQESGRDMDIQGLDNVPEEGPYFIASNHFARVDDVEKMRGPNLITDLMLSMAAMKKITNGKVLWPEALEPAKPKEFPKSLKELADFAESLVVVPSVNIARKIFFKMYEHADDIVAVPTVPKVNRLVTLYTKMRDHLKDGGVIGMFPEGESSHSLKKAKDGTSLLAIKKQVPVLPVSMYDDKGVLKVIVGKLLTPPEDRDQMENFTTEIMTQIASNLPDEMKGYYGPYTDVKLPGEIKQVTNFIKAYEQTKSLDIKGPVLRSVISGLSTIIPQEVEESKILERKDLLALANDLLNYEVGLNDRLDFELSGRTDMAQLIQESKTKEALRKTILEKAINNLPDKQEAGRIAELVNNLTVETETVERYIKEKQEDLTVEDAIKYRRVVNAIATCTVTALLLRGESLTERLKPLPPEQMNWDGIYKKYEWVFKELVRNPVEKAIVIMDRVATVGQIDDDWFGRHIDETLNIPSIALAAIKQANGDEYAARAAIYKYRSEYVLGAHKLGLGIIPIVGVTTGFKEIQKANQAFTRNARKHLGLIEKTGLLKKVKIPVREMAYIKGIL